MKGNYLLETVLVTSLSTFCLFKCSTYVILINIISILTALYSMYLKKNLCPVLLPSPLNFIYMIVRPQILFQRKNIEDGIYFQRGKAVLSLKIQQKSHSLKFVQLLTLWDLSIFWDPVVPQPFQRFSMSTVEGRVWAKAERAPPAVGALWLLVEHFQIITLPEWDINTFPRG